MKKKRGRSVRKNTNVNTEPEEYVSAPHSFVIHKGLPGGHITELTKDFRKVMEPYTAASLKERKKNTIKDFVQIAGPLHVSHLCIFTRTEMGMYFKLCKIPRGPTLTFKIHNFSLARDVVSSLKKQLVVEEAFKHSPLLVLNSFSGEGMQMKLMASMFQNMFPTINLTNVDLNTVRRCVLMNYNATTKLIDFRHFTIKIAPVGISKGVKKVVQGKVPNLANCNDIAEFLTKASMLSESEAEDDVNSHVTLPQKIISRGNIESGQSAIRLTELGPRLTLQLIKIEDGLLDGEILYHDIVQKTDEEKAQILKLRAQKKKLKERRKKVQEDNRKEKDAKKQILKDKSIKGMNKKGQSETDKIMFKASRESNMEVPAEEDDDVQYYRDELGNEPDRDLFSTRPMGMKRPLRPSHDSPNKRPRFESGETSRKFDNKPSKFNSKKFDRSSKSSSNGDDKKFGGKKRFDRSSKSSSNGDDKFGGKKKFRDDKKFGGKKSDGRKSGGNNRDKTNSQNRDFRPIGGKGKAKTGGRKGGKRRK